jgi:hypothetical protein
VPECKEIPDGIMGEWNIGMVGKNEALKLIIPSFHYSNIPGLAGLNLWIEEP